MGMIKKEVTGHTEDLKLVKNGKSAPATPMGGTSRPTFKGSNDSRKAGAVNSNKVLKSADGYINQGDVMRGDTSFAKQFTNPGKRGGASGAVTPASENVNAGMGGKLK